MTQPALAAVPDDTVADPPEPAGPQWHVVVPCTCPGKPHDSDWVDLWPEATLDIGAAATMAVQVYGHDPMQLQVALGHAFVYYGIRAWSYVDAKGNPVPVIPRDPDWPATVDRMLPWLRGGHDLAERADALYATDVLSPWMALPSMGSQPGPTAGPTSATPAGGDGRPRHAGRSSRTRTGGKRSGARVP